MNIGVPGTTEHDFDNHYDHSKELLFGTENQNHILNNQLFKSYYLAK